jgi:diaminopimelate epimerase
VRRPFTKVHVAGNSFRLLDAAEWSGVTDLPALARRLCDPRTGVGADWLAWITAGGADGACATACFFRCDGVEDRSGNGLLCAAWFAFRRGWLTNPARRGGTEIAGLIATRDGVHEVTIETSAEVNDEINEVPGAWRTTAVTWAWNPWRIRNTLPPAVHKWLAAEYPEPLSHLKTGWVDAGSPFVVIPYLPSDAEFHRISSWLENHPAFLGGTSVVWAEDEWGHESTLRVWRRGIGETASSGLATCAYLAWVGESSSVWMNYPGGELTGEGQAGSGKHNPPKKPKRTPGVSLLRFSPKGAYFTWPDLYRMHGPVKPVCEGWGDA